MRVIWVFLLTAIWFSGVAVAFVSHETRNLYGQLGSEKQRLEVLRTQWGQLTLERGALAAPMQLHQYAAEVGLQEPAESQFQVLPEVPE